MTADIIATRRETFEEIKNYWYPTVKELKLCNLIYLIANKIDLYETQKVEEKEAKKQLNLQNQKN